MWFDLSPGPTLEGAPCIVLPFLYFKNLNSLILKIEIHYLFLFSIVLNLKFSKLKIHLEGKVAERLANLATSQFGWFLLIFKWFLTYLHLILIKFHFIIFNILEILSMCLRNFLELDRPTSMLICVGISLICHPCYISKFTISSYVEVLVYNRNNMI